MRLAALLISLFSSIALADENLSNNQLDYLGENFLVAIPEGDFYPHYGEQNGSAVGYYPKLLTQFFNEIGAGVRFKSLPIARYLNHLKNGKADFIFPSNPRWIDNKVENITFSNPLGQSEAGYLRLADNQGKPIIHVATVAGYTLSENPLLQVRKPLFLLGEDPVRRGLELVLNGRVDSFYIHKGFVQKYLLLNSDRPVVKFDPEAGASSFGYRLSTIQHKQILRRLNVWLRKWERLNKYPLGCVDDPYSSIRC